MAQRARSKRRSGINARAYLGVEPESPINFEVHNRAPTTRDIKNRFIGDMWLHSNGLTDPTNDDIYILVSKSGGTARWLNFGAGNLERLRGNTGGYIETDVNENIDIVANTTHGLTVAGDPATSTLTIGTVNNENLLQSITGDVGGAVFPDVTNNISITGTNGITVTGTPGTNTLTLGMETSATAYITNAGTANPAAHNLQVLGTAPIATSAPIPLGNTVNIALNNGANGQVLIGGGANPQWASITSSSITITPGVNSLDFSYVPTHPAAGFFAYLSTVKPTVTGDGTRYIVICDTELFDINGDYDHTTGKFTAPYDGYYNFHTNITFYADSPAVPRGGQYGIASLETQPTNIFIGDNYPTYRRLYNFIGYSRCITYMVSISLPMTAGNTIWPVISSSLGGKFDSVWVFPNEIATYFYGYLLYRA
jgi:hypothetical protein